MATVLSTVEDIQANIGKDLGASEWRTITFEQIQKFADATYDHQWIHVDRERAAKGPFGAPIAHGYLTLSLVAGLFFEVVQLDGFKMVINYGCGKVRFPNPLLVGKRVRGHVAFGEVTDIPAGKQLVIKYTVEIEGETKPACVAETVVLLLAD